MMTVLYRDQAALVHYRVGTWVSLKALMAADQLDRQLAAGQPTESSLLLAVHAQRIVRPTACAALAGTLRRILAIAEGRLRPGLTRVPLCRSNVLAVAGELRALADRLEQPGPLRARGVAEVRSLLQDGTGSLYATSGRCSPGVGDHPERGLAARLATAQRHM
jgi:hypothetical protein